MHDACRSPISVNNDRACTVLAAVLQTQVSIVLGIIGVLFGAQSRSSHHQQPPVTFKQVA